MRRALLIGAGLVWGVALVLLAIRGIRSDGFLNYLDSGNVAGTLTGNVAIVVTAAHLWAERRARDRHREHLAILHRHHAEVLAQFDTTPHTLVEQPESGQNGAPKHERGP